MITLENAAKILSNKFEAIVFDTLREKPYRVICLHKQVADSLHEIIFAFNEEEFDLEVQQKLIKNDQIIKEDKSLLKISLDIDPNSAKYTDEDEYMDPSEVKRISIEHAQTIWLQFVFRDEVLESLAEKAKPWIESFMR